MGALDAQQVNAITTAMVASTEAARSTSGQLPDDAAAITDLLLRDARLSVAEIARTMHRPPATVRRHLRQLLASDLLTFRCDVAHETFGLPLTAAFFASVAQPDLVRTVQALKTLPQLRMCLQVTGARNLIFSVLARSLEDMGTTHEMIAARLPWMEVSEAHLLLRSVKRMGWMLDIDGKRTGDYVYPDVLREVL